MRRFVKGLDLNLTKSFKEVDETVINEDFWIFIGIKMRLRK